jgi:integrase
MKLTVRSVAAAPVGFTWDNQLPGFGLRVLASGRRSYVVRYRTATGTDRLLTLGTADELHPDAAREMARQAKAAVREGKDPGAERKARRAAPRLQDLRDRFTDDHATQKKPGTARNYEILWRLHIIPILGNPAVADITESDILKLRRRMADRPVNANRALEVLSKAFTLAERWRWRPAGTNPCRFVEAFPESPHERILEPAEVAAIWHELEADDILPSFRCLIQLLTLTGCRSSEWRLALWSWVDLDNAVLRLPDSKTGAKTVPLSPDVVEILRDLPRTSIYVLPGVTGGPIGGHRRIWLRVLSRAGVQGRVRIHDLRHTVGSYAHRAGASQRDVADLLGHKQMSTAARYIHGPGSEKHANAARASGAILAMVKKTKNELASGGVVAPVATVNQCNQLSELRNTGPETGRSTRAKS